MAKITPIKLSDALLEFREWQIAQRLSANTLKGYKTNMGQLLATLGENKIVCDITPQDVTKYMVYYSTKGQGTQNNATARMKGFFAFCRLMNYMSRYAEDSPANGWKTKKYEIERPEYLGANDFPGLIEAARKRHPLWASYTATGLYLMGRGPSELAVLKIKHLAITGDTWRLGIKRVKSKQDIDPMAVCGELRIELTRWLTWYNQWTMRWLDKPLQPEWNLFPASAHHPKAQEKWVIIPQETRSSQSLRNMTEHTLRDYGYQTRDETGRRNGWCGTHAFRRFGARAFFDELLTREGYDGALAVVREMLGHARNDITETYLNLKLDRVRRDRAVTANNGFMFAQNAPGAVTPIETKMLPASLMGGVMLGGAPEDALSEATAKILQLPVFQNAA
jgi:integrase